MRHLGPQRWDIEPGERIEFEKLPGGELRIRAARPTGTIDGFLHTLDGKVKLKKPLTIEEMGVGLSPVVEEAVGRAVDLVLEQAKELLTDEAYASLDEKK